MDEFDRVILRALNSIEGLAGAILFGSRATGRARPDSDLDVAILPASDAEPPCGGGLGTSRRRIQTRVAAALADLAPEGRVDVVLVDEAPELLRQRIMEQGRVLLMREPSRWQELRVRTMREHGDREFYRDMYRRSLRRRLAEGGASGGRS